MVWTHPIYLKQGESILEVDQEKSLELPQENKWNGLYQHCLTQTGVRKCLVGPTLQKSYFNLGESSKKSCSFLPSKLQQKTASVTEMLSDLKWDTLETRRKKNRLTLMYKLSHNLVDINTEEHLIPNSELRTRNSNAFKYRMPKVSKDVFKFSFFPRSITEWNSLPTDLVVLGMFIYRWLRFYFVKAVYPCHAPQSVHVCIFQFLQCIPSCTQKVSYTLLYLVFVNEQHP